MSADGQAIAPPPVDEGVERSSRLGAVGQFLADRPEAALLLVIALLSMAVHSQSEKGFFRGEAIATTLEIAAPLIVIAAGQTLVMLTAGIDLSVAGTATAAGYVMAAQGSEGTARALAVSLGVGLVIGLFNGIGIGIFQVNPLIMTLGTSIMIVGGLQVYAQRLQTGEQVVPSSINELSTGRIFSYVPTSMLLWVPLAILIVLGLRYSGFGRMLYAVGDNRRACRVAGVRIWQVLVAVYACCGVLAATAGILLAGANNPDTTLANDYLLPSVAAVVIGGTSIFGGVGGYVGTVLGAIVLTLLNNLLTLMDTTQEFKLILYGLIVLSLAWMYSALARRR